MARANLATRTIHVSFLILSIIAVCAHSAEALRVVSLYPGHTDNAIAIGAAGSIVAVSQNETPGVLPDAVRLPSKLSAEALLALRPNIVLTRSLNERADPNLRPLLESAGIAVHVIDPPSWDGFEEYLVKLSVILGVDPKKPIERLRGIRETVAERARALPAPRPRVFLEATAKEIHTCAPGSWAASLIELAGGVNAAADAVPLREGSPLAAWGVERAVDAAASGLDVYLVQEGPMNTSSREDVEGRPWFAAMRKALASGQEQHPDGIPLPDAGRRGQLRLAFIPERYLSRPSLSGLEIGSQMLLDLFRSLDPETRLN
jgi:iron complex transport system substrate-binding protein